MSMSFTSNFSDQQFTIVLDTPTEDEPTPLIKPRKVDYTLWFMYKLSIPNKRIEKLKEEVKLLQIKSKK